MSRFVSKSFMCAAAAAAATVAVALSAAGAMATDTMPGHEADAWRYDAASKTYIDPANVTCTEYVKVAEAYRPVVVAYYDGHAHGKRTLGGAEMKYEPVAVAYVDEQCAATPEKSLIDIVEGWFK